MTPEQFFVTEAIRHARELSYCDALLFLRGLLLTAGDVPEVADLRDTLRAMEAADAQLQLIADVQTKLNLNGEGDRK